jgi:hypothetical protein
MRKWTNLLPVILAVVVLSLNTACRAAEIKPETAPASHAPAVTETTKPASSNGDAAATTHAVAEVLGIRNVKVTSPSRPDVIVYPPSSKPSENSTVSARVWETLDFECVAEDQASHNLTYAWSCSAGKLRGDSSKVIWTAPGAGGDYTVTVKVTCDKGESTALTIKVTVKCCGD